MLIEALVKARKYVHLTHSNIAEAKGNDESPCKADLALIDAALEMAKSDINKPSWRGGNNPMATRKPKT